MMRMIFAPRHVKTTRQNIPVNPAQSDEANLSVVFPVVDSLKYLVGKDLRSREKRDFVFDQIDPVFLLVPLELELHASSHPPS